MKSSESIKHEFVRDGFVHIEGFYSPDEVQKILHNIERYKSEVLPGLDSFRALYDTDETKSKRDIKQLVDLDKSDAFFANLLHGDKETSLARRLLNDEVRVHTLEFFDKPPRIGKPTPPHQDGFFFCLKPNEAVTVWVALDDCDEKNGCLHYIRGSHQRPLRDHGDSGVVGFSQHIIDQSWDQADECIMKVRAGDCLAHHSGTIHFADANPGDRHRRSFGLVYFGERTERDVVARARFEERLAAQRAKYRQAEVNAP